MTIDQNNLMNSENKDTLLNIRQRDEKYWNEKLSGKIVNSTFFAESGLNDKCNNSKEYYIDPNINDKLLAISNNSDERLFILLFSILFTLNYKLSNEDEVMFGIPVLDQNMECDNCSGNNILLIRERVSGDITFKQLLLKLNQTILEAYEHQNYPIETLLYKLAVNQNQVDTFNYVNTVVLLDNLHDSKFINNFGCANLFAFSRIGTTLKCTIHFNSNIDISKLDNLFYRFCVLSTNILTDIDSKLNKISILTDIETDELTWEYNQTSKEVEDISVIDMFLAQLKKNPYAVAVTYGEKEITYNELNEKSEALSNILSKKGVCKGSIVALIFEPSIEMIISIFGVIKAGAAYLPLNPNDPQERIDVILRDSKTQLIIAQDSVINKFKFTKLQLLHNIDVNPILTEERPSIENLDELPMTNRSFVNLEKYNKHIGYGMLKYSISLQATRGCPYKCAYCHKIWPKKHFKRSAENIFEEVKFYYDQGIKRFAFIDDIFNLDRKNSERFFESIIKNNLDVQMFFPSGLRGDILTKDYIDLLVEAGTVVLALALETASTRLQTMIGKNLNVDKLRENILYICDKYPQLILEIFTMHGFPTETEDEAMMTLNFIKDIKWIHFPYINILKIYPNTDMADIALRHGVSYNSILESEDQAFHELPSTLPFSKEFTNHYQSDFLYNYLLSKDRLLKLLPYQMKILTEDELVQKYDSYLPFEINSFSDLLKISSINEDELKGNSFKSEECIIIPDLDRKLKKVLAVEKPNKEALKVLFIDVTLFFSDETNMLYNVFEPPLGQMSILTYLKNKLKDNVDGKIIKSRVDFDNFDELKK